MNIQYYKNQLIINDDITNGFIGIITLWTEKNKVYELLNNKNKSKVLTVGNLYTFNGLEWIIRNVCLNPCYEKLIITGIDNNKIIPKIMNDERVMNEEYSMFEELFYEYFNIESGNLIILKDYRRINDVISTLIKNNHNWINEPIIIPPPAKSQFQTYQSEESGFIVRDNDLCRLWKRALMKIKLFGVMTNGTREIMNLVSVLTKKPELNSEALIESGFINDEDEMNTRIESYLKQVCDEQPTEGLSYTYGSRIHGRNQIENCIRLLSENVLNRQACATTWNPPDDYYNHSPPCLVLVSFRIHPIINGEKEVYGLYMTTTFRSHDYMRAYFSNIYSLWQLGEKVLKQIRINTGKDIKFVSLTNLSIAAHVYENDFKKLNEINILDCALDKRGYFIISIDKFDKTINVQLMNSNNEQMEEFEGNDPHELSDKIQPFISEISHALYLGRELQKAKQCLDEGISYVQE